MSETNVTSVEQSDEEILKTVKEEEEPEEDDYLGESEGSASFLSFELHSFT